MCFCGGYERYLDALEAYATALEGRVNQPFPDGSYDIPFDVRLRAATTEFSHPRLGIVATNKHAIPITTEEAKELLSLRTRVEAGEADTRRVDWLNTQVVRIGAIVCDGPSGDTVRDVADAAMREGV
jgi:hypothetical protein